MFPSLSSIGYHRGSADRTGVGGRGGRELPWVGVWWERGGSGDEEVGFSILLWYFSVCRSFFPFLSFRSPLAPWMETRLSRLSGDRQYGPDNGLQSEVVRGERGREGGRDRATGEERGRIAH